MTKVSRKPLPSEDWEEFYDQICSVLSSLESKKEVRDFLNDLWTYTEKKMFSKRLQIARRLLRDQTYEEIEKRLNVTDNTIASVSEVLNIFGRGFEMADEKLPIMEEGE